MSTRSRSGRSRTRPSASIPSALVRPTWCMWVRSPMTTFPVLNYQNTALYVQSKVNEYQHVKINLTTEASTAHITNCANKAYTGICVFGTIFDDPDPTMTSVFQCNSVPNYTGYCNT